MRQWQGRVLGSTRAVFKDLKEVMVVPEAFFPPCFSFRKSQGVNGEGLSHRSQNHTIGGPLTSASWLLTELLTDRAH